MFWKWITPKTLGVVTQSSVYHWSIEGNVVLYHFTAFCMSWTAGYLMLSFCSIDGLFLGCEFNVFMVSLI